MTTNQVRMYDKKKCFNEPDALGHTVMKLNGQC